MWRAGAGAAAGRAAVSAPELGPVAGLDRGVVSASAFRTYYVPLNTQQQYIAALRAVRRYVERLRSSLGLDVYAYSIFHIFFEQYLDVGKSAALLLGAPAAAVAVATAVLGGSLWGAALLLGVLASLLLHLCGAMLLAGIQVRLGREGVGGWAAPSTMLQRAVTTHSRALSHAQCACCTASVTL